MFLFTFLARALAALALGIAATAVPAQPLTPPLSLDEAVRLGAGRSRQLAAYSAAASSARELAVSAGQRPDPVLTLGVTNLPINGPQRGSLTQDFMTMRTIGLMQQLTRADKLAARSARQQREAELAEARSRAALAQLQRDTALAWLDRHYTEQALAFYRSQRAEAQLQVGAVEAAFRANRGSQSDVFAVRSALARLDDQIQQAQAQAATARTRLARWIGDAAQRPLDTTPPATALRLDPNALAAQLERHPMLAVIAAQEAGAQAQADLARADQTADWRVEVMLGKRGPAYSDMLSVNFARPLQWDAPNRQDRELAARLATVEQLRAERDEALRIQVAAAREAIQQWQSRRERLELYGASLVPLALQRTEAALAGYRAGLGTLASVLEARRMAIDTRLAELRIAQEAAGLWAQLEYLIPDDSTLAPASAHKGTP